MYDEKSSVSPRYCRYLATVSLRILAAYSAVHRVIVASFILARNMLRLKMSQHAGGYIMSSFTKLRGLVRPQSSITFRISINGRKACLNTQGVE